VLASDGWKSLAMLHSTVAFFGWGKLFYHKPTYYAVGKIDIIVLTCRVERKTRPPVFQGMLI
tara:strand:- start:616 stop:801 length:186 start_codon:yes stop_codon:yes gene_type:complete